MNFNFMIAKFKSPFLWINFLLMFLLCVACILGAMYWLNHYTLHGQEIRVPRVLNMTEGTAVRTLQRAGLVAEIVDTGYVKQLPGGSILEQAIAPGTQVKAGRMIALTINSSNSPMLILPDLADNSSLREATSKLQAMGFTVTPPEYITGEPEWVYEVKIGGRSIVTGARIPAGAVITLVVGNGQSQEDDSLVLNQDYYIPMDTMGAMPQSPAP